MWQPDEFAARLCRTANSLVGRGRRTRRRIRIAKELGLRVFMRADNKRFLVILACLLIGVPAIDVAVKWSRNGCRRYELLMTRNECTIAA